MTARCTKKTSPILDRITKDHLGQTGIDALVALPPTDLQWLLQYVYEKRTKQRTTASLLMNAYEANAYTGVSELDQREVVRFDGLFYRALPSEVKAVELSPVCPLGVNSTLTRISQHKVLSTVRNLEVVADPTTALALECARRRKTMTTQDKKSKQMVHLATSQRLLRLQTFDKRLGYMQHFKCFAMCSAGRDTGREQLLIEMLTKHIAFYLDLVALLNTEGFTTKDLTVSLSDIRIMEAAVAAGVDRSAVMSNTLQRDYDPFTAANIRLPRMVDHIAEVDPGDVQRLKIETILELLGKMEAGMIAPLRVRFPNVRFVFDLARIAGIGYYEHLCFHVDATNKDGLTLQLSDGGFTDWTQQLLQNKKERLLTSGFGADLFHKMFRK